MTLYAVWKANTYTVTYNGNGSTGGSTADSSHVFNSSKALTSNGYTKTGYTFQGWSTSNTATTVTYTNGQNVNNLTSSNGGKVTLYAVWKPNTYTIVYNGNGATSGGTASSTHTYNQSKALTSNGYTRIDNAYKGYVFTGWNTAANGSGTSYSNGQVVNNLTSSNGGTITLYAQWTRVVVNVTFNPNGGSVTNGNRTYYQGDSYTNMPVPTRENYTFLGWYNAQNGGTRIPTGATVTEAYNHTLYAHWSENPWSGWTTTPPSDPSKYTVQTKTQYRYSDKAYTTSSNNSLSGWTLYNTTSVWSDYGAWSSWSQTAVSGSDSRQVESQYIQPVYTTYYKYFHYCNYNGGYWANCYYTDYGYGCTTKHTMETTTKLTDAVGNSVGSGTYYKSGISCAHGCTKWYVGSDYTGANATETRKTGGDYTQYRYRDRHLIYTYHFYRWGDWSSWSDSYVGASDSRKVETRTLYNYRLK